MALFWTVPCHNNIMGGGYSLPTFEPQKTTVEVVKLTCLKTVSPSSNSLLAGERFDLLGLLCLNGGGRANIEGSRSNVAMNAWLLLAAAGCCRLPLTAAGCC